MGMEEYEREVELIDYIEVLLKRKRLIMGGAVLCALVVGLLSLNSPRMYVVGIERQSIRVA